MGMITNNGSKFRHTSRMRAINHKWNFVWTDRLCNLAAVQKNCIVVARRSRKREADLGEHKKSCTGRRPNLPTPSGSKEKSKEAGDGQ